MTNRNKILLGVIGAAAAGVVVGMLLAPEKGKDMRKKIKKTTGDWADTVSHLFEKGKNKAEAKAKELKNIAEEKVNRAKESLS